MYHSGTTPIYLVFIQSYHIQNLIVFESVRIVIVKVGIVWCQEPMQKGDVNLQPWSTKIDQDQSFLPNFRIVMVPMKKPQLPKGCPKRIAELRVVDIWTIHTIDRAILGRQKGLELGLPGNQPTHKLDRS